MRNETTAIPFRRRRKRYRDCTRKYPQMFAKTTFVIKVFEHFTNTQYTRRKWATIVCIAAVGPAAYPMAITTRTVDVQDLLGLLSQFDSTSDIELAFDTNGDSEVDVTDFLTLLGEFGTVGCTQTEAPVDPGQNPVENFQCRYDWLPDMDPVGGSCAEGGTCESCYNSHSRSKYPSGVIFYEI